jgi:hypothetical protein
MKAQNSGDLDGRYRGLDDKSTYPENVWSFLVKGGAFLRSPSLRRLFPNL